MAKNSPAFQYYPADLLSDPEVMFWEMEAIGCYWQLITFLWLNGGKFEFKLEDLCKLFRVNRKKTAEKLWLKISKKFVLKDGIVTHKRILKEMQKQEASRLKRSKAGKKGMKSRWGNDNNVNNNDTEEDITENNPSSPVSSSTSPSIKEKDNKKEKIYFSLEIRQFENIQPQDIPFWTEAYPAVDIGLSIKQAAQWLVSNPTKLKKNYRRFLTNWFARTQERGGNKSAASKRNTQSGAAFIR